MYKRASMLLLCAALLSACGSSASGGSGSSSGGGIQANKSVRQVELNVERRVSRCMPSSGGAPDPLLLRRSQVRAKFVTCTGVVKDAKIFERCAFKVILGRIPTVDGVQKGLTACVEKAA